MGPLFKEEMREWVGLSRRQLLAGLGAAAAAGSVTLGSVRPTLAAESLPKFVSNGKKVKVGLGLNYGPFNQPWRRGCWRIVQTVLDNGGEIVTVRGEPSKQSEQASARQLLDRGIDVLILGIYSQESETAYIVEDAQRRGIKTVGFMVPVKDSPGIAEDTWGTAMTMGYYLQNVLNRQGSIVQTAENRGFYTPFDMEVDMLSLMTKFEPRMKMLPFMNGSVSTSDQISKGRENALSLLQANPDPQSLQAIVSWWWPLTLGASQALTQSGRKVRLLNHYFSDQLLGEMSSPDSPIEFSTDTPYHTAGDRVAELALALGQGQKVPNDTYHVPVTSITKAEAPKALAELKEMDQKAIALLKAYGG
ncbi:MAG: sugar ABC transporter substrate-binding protein [Xanthobacteraceae bacterium]